MLEIGNGGMNKDEYRTHMSLWAMLAAPLLNREVIALDQDPAGHQGDRVYTEGPLEVWSKPLADGSKAVAVYNRWTMPLKLDVPLERIGFKGTVKARDVWLHEDLEPISGAWHAAVPPHGVVLLRMSSSGGSLLWE